MKKGYLTYSNTVVECKIYYPKLCKRQVLVMIEKKIFQNYHISDRGSQALIALCNNYAINIFLHENTFQ